MHMQEAKGTRMMTKTVRGPTWGETMGGCSSERHHKKVTRMRYSHGIHINKRMWSQESRASQRWNAMNREAR